MWNKRYFKCGLDVEFYKFGVFVVVLIEVWFEMVEDWCIGEFELDVGICLK